MMQRFVIIYVFAMLLALQLEVNEALSQTELTVDPAWDIPEALLCPSEGECLQYRWVEPNLTLYIVSTDTNRVAVVPPNGAEARTYDLADQLQPYPQDLAPYVIPLPDNILLYRLSPFGQGIDILQLDRDTGNINQLVVNEIMPIVSCAAYPYIALKPFFSIEEEQIVVCSENPSHHFNVHIINSRSETVEQTLVLGADNLEIGVTRPWVQLEVGLDNNLYFTPHPYNTSIWGIQIPDDIQNFQIEYDIETHEYSLSPLFLPSQQESVYIGPMAIDEMGNKYIASTSITFNSSVNQLYKIDFSGNVVWQVSGPPLPNGIISIMLLDDGRIAVHGDIERPVVIAVPTTNASTGGF